MRSAPVDQRPATGPLTLRSQPTRVGQIAFREAVARICGLRKRRSGLGGECIKDLCEHAFSMRQTTRR